MNDPWTRAANAISASRGCSDSDIRAERRSLLLVAVFAAILLISVLVLAGIALYGLVHDRINSARVIMLLACGMGVVALALQTDRSARRLCAMLPSRGVCPTCGYTLVNDRNGPWRCTECGWSCRSIGEAKDPMLAPDSMR